MAAQSKTRKADTIVAGKALTEQIQKDLPKMNAQKLLSDIHALEEKLNKIYSGEFGSFPKIETKPFYFVPAGNFYVVDISRKPMPNSGGIPSNVDGVQTGIMSYNQFQVLANCYAVCPFCRLDSNTVYFVNDNSKYQYIVIYYDGYYRYTYAYLSSGNINASYGSSYNNASDFGSNYLRLSASSYSGVQNAIKYNLMPADLNDSEKKLFQLLVTYQNKNWLIWNSNTVEKFDDSFYTALEKDEVEDFGTLCFQKNSIAQYIKDGKPIHLSEEGTKEFVQRLVNVDTVRVDLSPYEESRLTDPNGGHWDLWSEKAGKNETLIKLDTAFYGRNPLADVRMDGIVGIDFGTKSTVVTVQDGNDTIVPMRVGCGDYKKDVAVSDYENPTVMELIDLQNFLDRYHSSESRPETEWGDLTISHTAAESMKTPKSGNEYYAWFSDLKQWASDKNRKIIIKDKEGKEWELCPFADINDADLNPIEYYAYLLGIFINNMYNGIYLHYLLSFPVTYERKIRQKIADSFEKGLKKSLPKAVQEDTNAMQLFGVEEGASEPAAYAVCALQEYGFQPQENEKILYGIFDFGGGTTDFDFGTWQRAPKSMQRRKSYIIKHFGAGGDRLLGGENLLELLAYHVFKNNEAVLRQNNVQFIQHPEGEKYCGLFEGGEALISDSQQAKFNQKQLVEGLRPLWYGEAFDKTEIGLNLLKTDGQSVTLKVKIAVEELVALIRRRIDSGVENFFEAMDKAVTEEVAEGVNEIHIFLAGNSSKSKVVLESFADFQEKYKNTFCKKLHIEVAEEKKKEKPVPDYFVKKYGKYLEVICDELEDYDEDILPKDDKFIEKLSVSDLLFVVCPIIFKISASLEGNGFVDSKLVNDLYKIWEEGVLTKEQMIGMVEEEFDSDYEPGMAIANFLYSNAETPENIKLVLKEYGAELIEEIADKTQKVLQERQKEQQEQEEKPVFILYPPLGTEEADAIRKEKGLPISTAITRPTGKTGVAYGLLECRKSSRIKVEDETKDTEEIKFNFYTGYNNFGKFEVVTNRDIPYGKWIEFIDAGEPDFELYFTDLPEAAGNQMSIQGVSKKICRIDETMDEAMVYIRAVEPSVLEYCAALSEEDLQKQEYLSAPKRIILE